MREIFYIVFLFFISFWYTYSANDIKIISRSEWWANENYRFIDSNEWKTILKKRKDNSSKTTNVIYTQEQVDTYKEKQNKLKEMDNILLTDYSEYIEINSKKYAENWKKLAWPVFKTKTINWIVIHHTYSNYESSLEWIKQIYKYHALTREWWDIWYNFLIWKDWEIYEWRAWWDYVVAAHDKWNNRWNIWIAIIWDYTKKPININQYNALKSLTKHVIDKYNIDITEKTYFHSECFWEECIKPLKTEFKYPIIWHRDAWHTECPWDELYKQIDKLRISLLKEPISVAKMYKKKIFKTLSQFPDQKLIDILANIEHQLDKKYNSNKLKVKWFILDYFKDKNSKNSILASNIKNNIKIKLSYPNNDKITIKTWWIELDIKRIWNKIYMLWKRHNMIKIPKKSQNDVFEISSWDRVPSWDKKWLYNDNKFRWDLYVYAKEWKLIVVNSLNIEDYLKWLWEVSDFEKSEKIKTIIIAARSYATWYTTKAKKFNWEFYDWVDDPNVFQKYLWYWLEERSPKINKVVNDTKWQLITYDSELIKPWYFTNSTWNTKSFYEYCMMKYTDKICNNESKKYPYLKSVVDKWSSWLNIKWHWVWISWKWVSYFADKWWTYDMIIKYFLKWVDIL